MAEANRRTVLLILNFLAFLCSFFIIIAGIGCQTQAAEGCININIAWSIIVIGLLVLTLSAYGVLDDNRSKDGAFCFLVFFIGFFIGLLLISLVINFIETGPDGSHDVPGKGYKEYRLEGYPSWLRDHVVDSRSWKKIRACLAHTNVCPKLTRNFTTADHFYASHLSPLQSGCCKPPTICGYTFVKPTLWTNASNPTGDRDCKLWRNDQTQLYYDCDSCKAGLLGDLRTAWKHATIILTVSVVVLICVYITACFQLYK